MPSRRAALLGLPALASLAGLASCGSTGPASTSPTVVSLGTATPGGGFQVYGQAFAETVNAADPGLRIEPRATRGSTENLPRIEAGELDLGLVTGEVLHEALAGIGRAPSTSVRIVHAMYANSGLFAVRADSALRSLDELRGRRVAWGAKGSGFVVLARYVADGLGLDLDRDFQSIYLDRAGDGPAMLIDGRIDALWGGGAAWPGFVAVADSAAGARFIAPDAAQRRRVVERHPFIKAVQLPAGSYRGQDAAIETLGSWSFVIARASLGDETAARIARALQRGEAAFAQRLPLARGASLANTLAVAPQPASIHPGVRRAMREAGLPA